jgi:hypothetical protein
MRTHNPFGESHWASRVRENLQHGSYGEGLETGRTAPRQSLTRQVFHKVLKSGCQVLQCRLRTADRLIRYVAVLTIAAWRIFWMTIVSRNAPDLKPSAV